jgi:hypothetical protein
VALIRELVAAAQGVLEPRPHKLLILELLTLLQLVGGAGGLLKRDGAIGTNSSIWQALQLLLAQVAVSSKGAPTAGGQMLVVLVVVLVIQVASGGTEMKWSPSKEINGALP